MRSFLTVASLAFGLCALPAPPNAIGQPTTADAIPSGPGHLLLEKPFTSGGTVVLTMNVGDVKVLPAPGSGAVRLQINTDQQLDRQTLASWVTRFDVAANRATLDVHIPKRGYNCNHCGTNVILYVPQQSDLKLDLGVGDVTITGIRGDKDLHVGIGDLRVGFTGPGEYAHVETHTRIGDIHDPLHHGEESGFLGKTEDFDLQGRYHLKATVGIGDLDLQREGNS